MYLIKRLRYSIQEQSYFYDACRDPIGELMYLLTRDVRGSNPVINTLVYNIVFLN